MVAKNSLFFLNQICQAIHFLCKPQGAGPGGRSLGTAGREGPPGVTEQGKKAGVDRGLFQDCLAPASRSPLPPRLPVMILTGAGW